MKKIIFLFLILLLSSFVFARENKFVLGINFDYDSYKQKELSDSDKSIGIFYQIISPLSKGSEIDRLFVQMGVNFFLGMEKGYLGIKVPIRIGYPFVVNFSKKAQLEFDLVF